MLYLVRHAQCTANVEKYWAGTTDSDVTANGYSQIACLKGALKDIVFDRVIVSPMKRALETSKALNSDTIVIDRDVIEFDGGDWENKPFSEIYKDSAYSVFIVDIRHCQLPNGENYKDVTKRLSSVIEYLNTYTDKNIAIVSHGTTLKILEGLLCKISPSRVSWLDNTAYSVLEYEKLGKWKLVAKSDSHIPNELRGFYKDDWRNEFSKQDRLAE